MCRLLCLLPLLACLCAPAAPAQAHMRAPSCATLDLRKVPVGEACMTRTDAEFRRVRDAAGALGWRDMQPGGRVWYDAVKAGAAQTQAAGWCAGKPRQGVPSLDDFSLASERGFLEVVGADFGGVKNPLLYSSQVDKTLRGARALGYSAVRRDFDRVGTDQKAGNALIICVSRAGAP